MRTILQVTFERTNLLSLWILCVGLVAPFKASAWAEELATVATRNSVLTPTLVKDDLAWIEVPASVQRPLVRVLSVGRPVDGGGECYVITHGMGGTVPFDRFHRLGATIRKKFPQARVLRIDWSERASAKIGIVPDLFKVAGSIDAVGDQAAEVLKMEGVNAARTTFIGESFGNWVNARIAQQMGGVYGILALNPAHEGGGYNPPDLRLLARQSWSFHTGSIFDTTREIAGSDFWLETKAQATHWEQHVAGMHWPADRVEAGDDSWLNLGTRLPERREGHFRASATLDGRLLATQPTRARSVPAEDPSAPANVPATDIAMTAP